MSGITDMFMVGKPSRKTKKLKIIKLNVKV